MKKINKVIVLLISISIIGCSSKTVRFNKANGTILKEGSQTLGKIPFNVEISCRSLLLDLTIVYPILTSIFTSDPSYELVFTKESLSTTGLSSKEQNEILSQGGRLKVTIDIQRYYNCPEAGTMELTNKILRDTFINGGQSNYVWKNSSGQPVFRATLHPM